LNSTGQELSSALSPVTTEGVSTEIADRLPADAGPKDYVQLALLRNPGLEAARQKVARLTARIPQVTSLSDPMFKVSPVGEMAETAAGQVQLMAGISQKLPLPGKLEARGRIAAQDAAIAVQELHDTRLRVIADTRRAYWNYYFTTQAIAVTQTNRQLLAQFRQIAQSKFKSGTASQQDVLRASVELSNVDKQLITLHQQQATSTAMLNTLLNQPVTGPLPKPKAVVLEQLEFDLDQLLAQAAASNPGIQKAHYRIQGFRERLELARLNRWPDLTLSANYVAVDNDGLSGVANGDDQWWFGFGINLPIWFEKLNAAQREAKRGVFEGIAQLRHAQNQVAFGVQDALVKVETDQRLVVLFRDVIVPQAQQTVDASLSSYQAGGVEFLTLVDNWHKLLDFQVMYHQNLARLEQDFAQLQKVVGHDLQRQPKSPAPEAL